ncbi:MAG: O-antigen ligase family protein [Acidobacteriia bacterium]|nr:O-antigen ligase family protein [Terriglobia bacterium]
MDTIIQFGQNDPGETLHAGAQRASRARRSVSPGTPLASAYVALQLFILVYWVRPTDWVPGMSHAPLAKITGILALLALLFSVRHIRGNFPREIFLLALLAGQLLLSAATSPVWKGGALQAALDFAKVPAIFLVMTLALNSQKRLQQVIFLQAGSIAVIAGVTIWKSHLLAGRLAGAVAGAFSDPNDLALTIVISLPLALALTLLSRNWFWKIFWAASIVAMSMAILLTGSRGGYLALAAAAVAGLWEFAVRGRRGYLVALALLGAAILWQVSGGMVAGRMQGIVTPDESVQQRQQLFWRSLEVTREHPLFGVGAGNFEQISGNWHVTHNSYTQMSSEGGVPALVLYLMILGCGFRNLRAAKRLAREHGESSVVARALLASLAAYLAGSAFLSMAYEFFPYLLVAYTTALAGLARHSTAIHKKDALAEKSARSAKPQTDPADLEMLWQAK